MNSGIMRWSLIHWRFNIFIYFGRTLISLVDLLRFGRLQLGEHTQLCLIIIYGIIEVELLKSSNPYRSIDVCVFVSNQKLDRSF